MVLPSKPFEEIDPTYALGYAPDGLNSSQNASVGIVKKLVADWFNKEDVIAAIPALQSAVFSNKPPLTLAEAIEIWNQIYGFYVGYFGSQESQLQALLEAVENLFPAAAFGKKEMGGE